jgi:hypothetical protein
MRALFKLWRKARAGSAVALALAALGGASATGCKKKVTPAQCDELLDRFAMLVVREKGVREQGAREKGNEATPEQIKAEQARERDEARSDDNFKNCTSELSTEDYACAMAATTADALMKCLE